MPSAVAQRLRAWCAGVSDDLAHAPAALRALRALHVGDSTEAFLAAIAIDKCHYVAPLTVPWLMLHLADRDAPVRRACAQSLGRLTPLSQASVPALIMSLNDPDADVRTTALRALSCLGPAARLGTPFIFACLFDHSPAVRAAAGEAMTLLGLQDKVMVPGLLRAMTGQDHHFRLCAIDLLRREMGSNGAVESALIELLSSADSRARQAAAESLSLPATQVHQPSLIAQSLVGLIEDPEPTVRKAALEALAKLRWSTPQAGEAVAQALADPDCGVRIAAARLLPQTSQRRNLVSPLLLRMLDRQPDEVVAGLAALAAMNLELSPSGLAKIRGLLSHESGGVGLHAARGLLSSGLHGYKMIAACARTTDEDTLRSIRRALGMLREVTPQEAGVLARMTDCADPLVRTRAALAMERAPELEPAVAQALFRHVGDPDSQFRSAVRRALSRADIALGSAFEAVAVLLEGIEDREKDIALKLHSLPREALTHVMPYLDRIRPKSPGQAKLERYLRLRADDASTPRQRADALVACLGPAARRATRVGPDARPRR